MTRNHITKIFVILLMAVALVTTLTGVKAIAAPALDMEFATESSAVLIDTSTIKYTASLPSIPKSDDSKLYLYAIPVYCYEINDEATLVGEMSIAASDNPTQNPEFTFALNHKSSKTRLYQKFALCVKSEGKNVMIAHPQYITNPELLATSTHERGDYPLKGLQGVDFGNLVFSADYEAITNPAVLNAAMCVVNKGHNQLITNPYSRENQSDSHNINHDNFLFNCNDAVGVRMFSTKLENVTKGAVNTDDWIIGNEVNERICNYMVWVSWDEFMRQYEQEFRVAYNAIKSTNANAKVYISVDQNWDRNMSESSAEYYSFIDAKDFIEDFASNMKAEGDIDWGVCQHPYLVPLTYAKFWDMSGCANGDYMKRMVTSDSMVSFQNIGVITKFLGQDKYLNPAGEARSLLLSEVGICDAQGSEVQAAALYASYEAAKRQPSVSRIIYLSADCGTFNSTFTEQAQEMYDNMDGADAESYEKKAMKTIGISDWSDVLR